MNLEKMVSAQINAIVPRSKIQIILYTGQTNNSSGKAVATYAEPYDSSAQVQLTARQTLEHIEGANYTRIYKDFRLQSNALSGLNRNINTGGDFIKMDDKYYKIVALPENFKTGWLWVVGQESSQLGT